MCIALIIDIKLNYSEPKCIHFYNPLHRTVCKKAVHIIFNMVINLTSRILIPVNIA